MCNVCNVITQRMSYYPPTDSKSTIDHNCSCPATPRGATKLICLHNKGCSFPHFEERKGNGDISLKRMAQILLGRGRSGGPSYHKMNRMLGEKLQLRRLLVH